MKLSGVSKANSEFWNELCGSQLARSIGVIDDSSSSLRKFDNWYLDFYPYLESHIPFEALSGKKEYCELKHIQHDIAWTEESRIDGDGWYQFVSSSNAMLGSESGGVTRPLCVACKE